MNIIDYSKEQGLLKQEPGRKWFDAHNIKTVLLLENSFCADVIPWVCRCISV